MKTTAQVIQEYGRASLVRSIVRAVGRDSLEDICKHGADSGFPGITYTADCMALAWRNKEAIRELLEEYAQDFGQDIGPMLQSWKCIGKDYSTTELVRALYIEHKPKFDNEAENTLWNGLAWFAAEEVARWFCDE